MKQPQTTTAHRTTMKFRPCIDLHHGQVKQIVGSTLTDSPPTTTTTATTADGPTTATDSTNTNTTKTNTPTGLTTNFVSSLPASAFAERYARDHLTGGHVIMLDSQNESTRQAALSALAAHPRGLHIGGGITNATALDWIAAGASHVIVTSHVFQNGHIHYDRLRELRETVTKEKLVLDLSCRRKPRVTSNNDTTSTTTTTDHDQDDTDDNYYVVTDRWQTFTDTPVTRETLVALAEYCDEFLVHGVDVEGMQCGILIDLVRLLGAHSPIPVTYAGGVRSLDDVRLVQTVGQGRVDCTIGSALDIFGGPLSYDAVVQWHHHNHHHNTNNATGNTNHTEHKTN